MFTKAGKTKMKLRVCVWFWAEGLKTCYESCRETEWQWLTGNDERKVCSAFKNNTSQNGLTIEFKLTVKREFFSLGEN